jgi:uncharacterized membrane protein YidH (DUF202 family)
MAVDVQRQLAFDIFRLSVGLLLALQLLGATRSTRPKWKEWRVTKRVTVPPIVQYVGIILVVILGAILLNIAT